jgi:secretion/DNA translocation related TadE-like protein
VRRDDGSGSVLAISLVGAAVVVALAVLALGSALVMRQRVIAAADGAALAAADAASGALAGVPCASAAAVAEANGAALSGCRLDGLIATVEVSDGLGVLRVRARSTAGPPP